MSERRLVECVPNFSEGRRPEVVEEIVAAVRATPGAALLDYSSDASHNRSVVTFVGDPEATREAALAAVARAVALIDLRHHAGEHPRIGAADVVPFVPVANATMVECVALAQWLGQRIWERLRVPVYYYAEAATRPERRRLPDIRKGEFEGLAEKMADPAWRPDVGDPRPHPTAGAVVVGARRPLIAYNINLATRDVGLAKVIARAVRESGGGLAAIQAMGVASESGLAQVSINVLDYTTTSLVHVFSEVRRRAADAGVEVAESEIVGLVPLDAVAGAARDALRLRGFSRDQILEAKMAE